MKFFAYSLNKPPVKQHFLEFAKSLRTSWYIRITELIPILIHGIPTIRWVYLHYGWCFHLLMLCFQDRTTGGLAVHFKAVEAETQPQGNTVT